jgi:hypothetical protein
VWQEVEGSLASLPTEPGADIVLASDELAVRRSRRIG